MCGILGFFGGKKPNLDFFNEILEITNHRLVKIGQKRI